MGQKRILGVRGAILIALNLGADGFVLFLVSSVLWGAVVLVQREPSLIVLPSAFTAVNLLGLWQVAVTKLTQRFT